MDTLEESESVKLGTKTPKVRVADAFREPDVPVIVTVYCPVVAVLPAVKVRVLIPVVGLGVKVAVTPLGKPDAARVTLPLNPYMGLTKT
jgi:hypothetical protein